MRLEFLMALATIISICSCKTFEGSYCTPPNYTGACIEFKSKTELLYYTGTDYSASGLNYGIYRTKKDTLVVDFQKIPEKYKLKSIENYKITGFNEVEGDSIEFDIKCNRIPYAQIFCVKRKENTTFYNTETKVGGKITFKVSKAEAPFDLRVNYIESDVVIPIIKSGEYNIAINLNNLMGQARYDHRIGTTSKFLIQKNDDGIFLKQVGSKKGGKFYKYE